MFILASSQRKPRTTNLPKLPLLSQLTLPPISNMATDTQKTNEAGVIVLGDAKLVDMVIPVLLMRCREVLQRFVVDDRQSGQCPMPRYRLVEVCSVQQNL